jgi:formate hydrogenlyase transcriptional activator
MQTSDSQPGHAGGAVDTAELAALRLIAEGTAPATGREFFHSLVEHLAKAMGTGYALVAEFAGHMRARTLGYWKPAGLAPDVEWDLVGTPCEDVIRGKLCHHPTGVKEKFPADEVMVEWGIESYLGVPLVASDGHHLGHLAVFDTQPMPSEPRRLMVFRIFAARAAAELERLRMERELSESERRFRDLYEEAPIAYVLEDISSRFLSANRAACRLLGVRPEDVPGTVGMSFVAQTPGNLAKIKRALENVGGGQEQACLELELRRKDDGRPVWVQWWSKPEPDGKHTRTMMVDVTERVLMEREKARLEQQNAYLQEEINSSHNFEEIVGRSAALVSVLENVGRVAPTDASVLVTGETGTGKELIARAIHSHSSRKDKPLIKLNCAALPAGLVESELFGHERGAFSGAIARRIGRFELAHGGTIFLDEIGEIPPEVQVKLLRVLQEREIERVGGSTPIKADVRVIAATNRDLAKLAREGKFREDLFYRLNVFPLRLPPLRERAGDVPLLVQFLVDKFRARIGKPITRVSPQTMRRLVEYPWPGNVRELENVIERAVILAAGPVLEVGPELLGGAPPPGMAPASATSAAMDMESVEREHVRRVLEQTGWVIEGPKGAAQVLNVHPNTLRSRLKRLGIRREESQV